LFFDLKGSAAALPTPNTNLANGSVVPDFFFVAGFVPGFAGFEAPAVAGRYAGMLPLPYDFGFCASLILEDVALARRPAPYIRFTPSTYEADAPPAAAALIAAVMPCDLILSIVACDTVTFFLADESPVRFDEGTTTDFLGFPPSMYILAILPFHLICPICGTHFSFIDIASMTRLKGPTTRCV
jgi:hypothetical protein